MKYFIGLFILLFAFILPAQNPYNQGNLTGNTSGTKKRTPLNTLERASGPGQSVLTDAQGNLRYCNAVDVNLVPVLVPPSPTGNLTNLGKFVSIPSGDVYFIDYYGESVALGKPSQDSTTASNGLVMVGNDVRLINYNIAPIGSIPIKAINGSLQWGIPIYWKTTGNDVNTEPGGLLGYVGPGSDAEVAMTRGNIKRIILDDKNTIEINDGSVPGTNSNENQDFYLYSHDNISNGAGIFIQASGNESNISNFFQRCADNKVSGIGNMLIYCINDTVYQNLNTLIRSSNLNVNGNNNVYINCQALPPVTSSPDGATIIDRSVEIDGIGESGIVTDRISTVSARVEELPSKPDYPNGHPVGFDMFGNLVPIATTGGGGGGGNQTLYILGQTLSITGGNTVLLPDKDQQTLSLAGLNLSISNGNTITLPVQPDADNQNLSISGQNLTISGGNTVVLPDKDQQTLSLAGQNLSISNGNTITLPIQPEYDNQTLSISGQNLSISGGNTITLPTINAWLTSGNAGTNSAFNFWGTTDPQNVVAKANNVHSFTLRHLEQSMQVGDGTASGTRSFAQGSGISNALRAFSGNQGWATAQDASAFNIGRAYGTASFAVNNGTANGAFAFAAGRLGIARGLGAIALGHNAEARSLGEIELGLFPTIPVTADSSNWVGTDRIFNIGKGQDIFSRSDAMTILKNGNTGISNNAPAEKLDVVGKFRLTDRSDIPTKIAGWSATDRSADITIGSGLTLSAGGVLSAGSAGGVSLTDVSASYANSTIDNLNFTKTLNHSSLTNQSALTIVSPSITSGRLLRIESSSSSYTGEEGFLTVTNATSNTLGMTAKIQMGSNATNSFVFRNNGNEGTGTLDPKSWFEVNGTIGLASSHQTTATVDLSTISASIIYLEGLTAQSVILPTASTVTRRYYTIINKTNIQAGLSNTYRNISGSLLSILPARNSITIVSDGTEWIQIGGTTMVPAEKIQLVTATISTTLDPDVTYICNGSANINLTLPSPNTCGNCQVSISRGTATGTITVFPGGGNIQEYDGTMNSQTSIPLHTVLGAGFNHTFKSDGASNWYR